MGPVRDFLFFCTSIGELLKIIDRISPLQPSVMGGMQSQVIGGHLDSRKKTTSLFRTVEDW